MVTRLDSLRAIEGTDSTVIHNYGVPRRGINLYGNIMTMSSEEALQTQNCFVRAGLKGRMGQTKFETDEVVADKKIIGLHRFYYGADNKQLIVVSDSKIRYHNGSTWADIDTGQTAGKNSLITTWGALDKVFICNGTDPGVTWTGSSAADMSGTNAPAKPIQVLPYRDRLLAIDATKHGDVQWSASFSDTGTWETISACGVRPDSKLYGMILHTDNNSNQGIEAKVLLAGANGMHLFSGKDLRTPSTTGDYRIESLATSVGCNAPWTMCWTPAGSMYLGRDKQVYLVPFKTNTPIPVGHKITSRHPFYTGIEKIPVNQIENACAIYHDGFYKLSFAGPGQTINNTQYWLDINHIKQDENGLYGPWYGPMLGQNISVFATQNGPGDLGELMAGESDLTIGSFVYQLSKDGILSDNGTSIPIYWQSFYHPLGDPNLKDAIHMLELELLDTSGTLEIEFHDIDGAVNTGNTVDLGGGGLFYGDTYWGEAFWGISNAISRKKLNIGKGGGGTSLLRRCSLKISYGSATETMEIYNISLKTIPQNIGFD